MEELEEVVENVIGAMDDFIAAHVDSPDTTRILTEVLRRLGDRADDGSAHSSDPEMWASVVVDDDEAFENAPTSLLILDKMGFITRANATVVKQTETDAELMLGRHVGEFIHADDYGNVSDIWVRMQVEPDFNSASAELRLINWSGAKWYRAALRAIRNEDRTLSSMVVQLTDVGDKHEKDKQTDISSRKFGNLLDNFPTPIIRFTRDHKILFANPTALSFYNANPTRSANHQDSDEGRANHPSNDRRRNRPRRTGPSLPKEDQIRYMTAMEENWLSGEATAIDLSVVVGDQVRWCEVTLLPEVGPSGHTETMLTIWRDQTNRRRHEQLLAHQARHDALTGLPNRAHFAELLELAISRQQAAHEVGQSQPLAVLFLDLDRFKFVNDSLGHLAGDELLRGVSDRLSNAVRPGDVIGRLGGDEFTILAENITGADAQMMAIRIQNHLKKPFKLTDREFRISASIGVVTSDTPQDSSDLMRWADSAMYRAKSLGRDRVMTFSEALSPDVLDQLDFDQAIRSAVEHDELELYYQPEVDLTSYRVVGVEALVRWSHPTRGLLGANKFIPVAEDNGMIVPIGAWVMRSACEQTMKWRSMGILPDDFVLHVNIATRQLAQHELVELVSETLQMTGMPPEMLCLEITETGLMHEVDHGMEVLKKLDDLGISLAIDDFGTGYSSLSSLRTFPIDMLKIDMSFVRGITSRKNDAAIAKTILTLADTLGLTPTAEGIETIEQCRMLAKMGCTRGQGYLFSKPVPVDEIENLIRRRVLAKDSVAVGEVAP